MSQFIANLLFQPIVCWLVILPVAKFVGQIALSRSVGTLFAVGIAIALAVIQLLH